MNKTWLSILFICLIAGCTSENTGDKKRTDTDSQNTPGADGDTDTDTDTDSDTDSDTDTDTDTDVDTEWVSDDGKRCQSEMDCYGGEVCEDEMCVDKRFLLINPSGEINNGEGRVSVNDASVVGWHSEGREVEVIKDGTDYGNGGWRFSLEDESELYQMTSHEIEEGAAYGVRFDAASFSGLPSRMVVELYVLKEDERTAVSSWTVDLKTTSEEGVWHHYNIALAQGVLDDHAGSTLGLQFKGVPDSSREQFYSVDNIRLDYWPSGSSAGSFSVNWEDTPDRIWSGPGLFANRLQDWEVVDGRLACISTKPYRTVHRVGTSVQGNLGDFTLSVRTGLHQGTLMESSRTGLFVGSGFDLDWRGGMLFHHTLGRDAGLFFGLTGDGRAVIEDLSPGVRTALDTGESSSTGFPDDARIALSAKREDGNYTLTLTVYEADTDTVLSEASTTVAPSRLLGSFGLLSHPGDEPPTDDETSTDLEPPTALFWFNAFEGSGSKLQDEPERHMAIYGALHTLSRGTLKLAAQMSPMDVTLNDTAYLEIRDDDDTEWEEIASAPIDPEAYNAIFKVTDWDDTVAKRYRVRLPVSDLQGDTTEYTFDGVIRRDPVNKEEMVVTGLACQMLVAKSIESSSFDWSPDNMYHPHAEVVRHAKSHRPDLVAMTGDQIYEQRPTPPDNTSDFNRHYDYLYKWFIYHVQWNDVTRVVPAFAIPDDHDVYQGNLWGEGGIASNSQNTGGYTKPASFVKMVERTQTSSLPDAFDPTPVAQDIGVYYTGIVYGRLGIAVLEDRKFKTGQSNPPPEEEQALLGERQHVFLRAWAEDWSGQDVKFAVSQSPLINAHTHGGRLFNFGEDDKDSNGWPPHRRDEAVDLLRRGYMFHLAGDQHLATVLQHGIESPRDAGYSFTVPAVASLYSRAWDPAHPENGTTTTVSPYKGDYVDYFGNHLYMRAVANPARYYQQTLNIRPTRLHNDAPGYGIVRINKRTRTVQFETWPRYSDPEYPQTGGPYADWPIRISQFDNYGRAASGYLPVVDTGEHVNPVIVVKDESSEEVEYAVRLRGNRFHPPVYDNEKTYIVELFYGDSTVPDEILSGQSASAPGAHQVELFESLRNTVEEGETATLRWDVRGSSTISIDQDIGNVDLYTVHGVGVIDVTPTSTTTYTLTSKDSDGETLTETVTLKVE